MLFNCHSVVVHPSKIMLTLHSMSSLASAPQTPVSLHRLYQKKTVSYYSRRRECIPGHWLSILPCVVSAGIWNLSMESMSTLQNSCIPLLTLCTLILYQKLQFITVRIPSSQGSASAFCNINRGRDASSGNRLDPAQQRL